MNDIQVVLLDIEGTTTPIEYVYKTLFPYARSRSREFLLNHYETAEVADIISMLSAQQEADDAAGLNPPYWQFGTPGDEAGSAVAYVHWLMDRDRKVTALKILQGRIWREGYENRRLTGEVYPDVLRAFTRWREAGVRIAIFSSGSVEAQQLLFANSIAGDLTEYIEAYFDTTTGPKREASSYERIAAELGIEAEKILFVSDVAEELDAADIAGMYAALSVRPGMESPVNPDYPIARDFDSLLP